MTAAMIAVLVLMSAEAAPTLKTIKLLSAQAAGELALNGRDHRPISKIASPPNRALLPPGIEELDLFEIASAQAGGCVRKKWRVTFRYGPGKSVDEATVTDAYASTEVALVRPSGCNDSAFAHINGELEMREAMVALKYLDDILRGKVAVQFSCSDTTNSALCGNSQRIRSELANESPWAVMRRGDSTIMWLGETGQVVTEVRYERDSPDQVTVERRIPSPA